MALSFAVKSETFHNCLLTLFFLSKIMAGAASYV